MAVVLAKPSRKLSRSEYLIALTPAQLASAFSQTSKSLTIQYGCQTLDIGAKHRFAGPQLEYWVIVNESAESGR